MPRRSPAPDLDQALADALVTTDEPRDEAAIDATAELLATHGLRNWTVDDVARLSRIGRATLYRRYGSRDVLIQLTVTREARRFFAAIAAKAMIQSAKANLTEMVVDGLQEGLRLAEESPLGDLITRDPATAMALIANTKLLDAATHALTDVYLSMTAVRDREQAEARAEALVRLAISLLLFPNGIERERLRSMVTPLVEEGRFQSAERLKQTVTAR